MIQLNIRSRPAQQLVFNRNSIMKVVCLKAFFGIGICLLCIGVTLFVIFGILSLDGYREMEGKVANLSVNASNSSENKFDDFLSHTTTEVFTESTTNDVGETTVALPTIVVAFGYGIVDAVDDTLVINAPIVCQPPKRYHPATNSCRRVL